MKNKRYRYNLWFNLRIIPLFQ